MKISAFTVWQCPCDLPPIFSWRTGLPGSRHSFPKGVAATEAIICLETECGQKAWTKTPRGPAAFDLVRSRFHAFLGEDPLMSEKLWTKVWEIDRLEEMTVHTLGLLDMLAWDLKSRISGLPVYQLLGGYEQDVPAYASTVTFDTLDEYERMIKLSMDVGFKAFKLHAWGDVKRDIELAIALRQWVGPDADIMFDASAGWDVADATTVGRALEGEGYLWYEEPMREFHLGSYTRLCHDLTIPVLAAETSDGCHWNAASWIEANALDMMRVSAHFKGGMTGAIKVAHLAESFGMRAQVHGGNIGNAQLCAAIPNNDYYEQLVINEDQIKGLAHQSNLPVIDGFLHVSDEPGMFHGFDCDDLDARALDKHCVSLEDL